TVRHIGIVTVNPNLSEPGVVGSVVGQEAALTAYGQGINLSRVVRIVDIVYAYPAVCHRQYVQVMVFNGHAERVENIRIAQAVGQYGGLCITVIDDGHVVAVPAGDVGKFLVDDDVFRLVDFLDIAHDTHHRLRN